MRDDDVRLAAYLAAIARADLSGKTVLDLGTGPDVVLAAACVEAGAARVRGRSRA